VIRVAARFVPKQKKAALFAQGGICGEQERLLLLRFSETGQLQGYYSSGSELLLEVLCNSVQALEMGCAT
jgi:hypothetical protein